MFLIRHVFVSDDRIFEEVPFIFYDSFSQLNSMFADI